MKHKFILILFASLLNALSLFGQIDTSVHIKPISVEVQEVQELLYIIFSITEEGLSDTVLINTNSDYYRKVRLYFDKYRSENIVRRIGKKLASKHYQIQMDASNYSFDKHDNLIRNKKYNNLSWGKKDYLEQYKSNLEDFSRKTNYREFYKKNKVYYESLASLMQAQVPIDKQLIWLNNNFPRKYKHIKIIFSPLNNGKHATNYKIKDLIIWVSNPLENKLLSKTLIEAFTSRMLFTEIDHNYVNPISDLYSNAINKIFKKRGKWVNESKASWYNNPYSVFNEYMTWSVFVIFAFDTYKEADFIQIQSKIENMMINYRGFSNFKSFENKMLELYKNKTPKTLISDLYPDILEWCEKQ